jgi:hypothetical protein
MKSRQFLSASLLMLVVWALPITPARADSVLYDSTSLVQGQQSFVQSFNIATPGTLTVTLSTIPWLDAISNLTCFLSTTAGMVGKTMGSGTESIDITSGTIYAHWFGDAQGTYNIGALGIKIAFQPSNVTPVPLPASFVLLLSGLGILLSWQRRESTPGRVMQAR